MHLDEFLFFFFIVTYIHKYVLWKEFFKFTSFLQYRVPNTNILHLTITFS